MLKTKIKKCPICGSKAIAHQEKYETGKYDKLSMSEIIVHGIDVYKCSDTDCAHSWLPIDQERKIDQAIAKEGRFDLLPQEISMIRESLPFSTKFQTADFLCLNEKAFTKWELGYSGPNRAYDLLLRLSVFSRDNFAFIKHLHETNFQFDPKDYQLVCDRHNLDWNLNVLIKDRPKGNELGNIVLGGIKGQSILNEKTAEVFIQTTSVKKMETNDEETLAA